MRMCFFRCISLARVFIPRVSEFSLCSYRPSKYFLASDFIILRKSFSIDFCLCFRLPQGRLQPHPQYVSHLDGQVSGVRRSISPLTSISNQASSSLHQDPLGSSSSLGPLQRGSLTPSNNMDSLCDKLCKHEYEDNFDSLHVINPFSVSTQSSGKLRLILDLRFVNQFILKQKVKFQDYTTALDLFQYGGYAYSLDFKE